MLALATPCVPALAQPYQPPQHTVAPPLFDAGELDAAMKADTGTQLERARTAKWVLAEHRRLGTALAALQPQRKGVVDAYVVSVALDSDPVFGREAREAGRVLGRRYGADGRTLVLGGTDGSGPSDLPRGSPEALAAVLARVAELMDPTEDVLVLYTTSHGGPFGIVYHDGDQGFGAVSPFRLWSMLEEVGIRNRMLMISACYSGVFVPLLQSDTSVVVTAASSERTSFGCVSDNDWTFFGDALINHALRKPQPLDRAVAEARQLIGGWEIRGKLIPSEPQLSIGSAAARWLAPLEARMPAPTPPIGRPAVLALEQAEARNR